MRRLRSSREQQPATAEPPLILSLPPDLTQQVLVASPAESVLQLCATCAALRVVGRDGELWRIFATEHLRTNPHIVLPAGSLRTAQACLQHASVQPATIAPNGARTSNSECRHQSRKRRRPVCDSAAGERPAARGIRERREKRRA